MDRVQLFLLGLPVFLFCSDILNLFTAPPHQHHHHHRAHQSRHQQVISKPPDFPTPQLSGGINEIGYGAVIDLSFCSSCSYRGTAVTMKKMLETSFPGVEVVLSNHPPTLPKRLLGKVVPVVQFGVIAIVMAGEHIFPRLGFIAPPPWYFSLRANRFGTIASTWLLGNVVQNFLQSSGAFEVYFNGELPEVQSDSLNDRYKSGMQMDSRKRKRKGWSIFSGVAGGIIFVLFLLAIFSKLREHRFPGEIELRDLVNQKLATGRVVDGAGSVWS